MKREFLESLNIEKDKLDAIMAENGKCIESLKAKIKEIDEKDGIISRLTAEKDTLSSELSKAKNSFSELISSIIKKTTEDICFSSISAKDNAAALMKNAAETGGDIFSVIKELRESDPSAFVSESTEFPIFSLPEGNGTTDEPLGNFNYIRQHY